MNTPILRKWICALLAAGALDCLVQPANLLAGPGYTPVRDVDNAISNPFARELGWFENNTYNPGTYTVPAGKLLEITGISGSTFAPACTNVYVTVQVTSGGTTVTHRFALMLKDPTIASGYMMMPYAPVHVYADTNTTVSVVVRRDVQPGTGVSWYCDVVLTGKLVNQ
jgi:hypothetical protein